MLTDRQTDRRTKKHVFSLLYRYAEFNVVLCVFKVKNIIIDFQ